MRDWNLGFDAHDVVVPEIDSYRLDLVDIEDIMSYPSLTILLSHPGCPRLPMVTPEYDI